MMRSKIFQYFVFYLATLMFTMTMAEWIRKPWEQILDYSFFLDVAICVFFIDAVSKHLLRNITITINFKK